MTMEEQAKRLEAAYTQWHRIQNRTHATPADKQEALETMKAHQVIAEQTLRLPGARGTPWDRSQLRLWAEMVKGTLREVERGQQ